MLIALWLPISSLRYPYFIFTISFCAFLRYLSAPYFNYNHFPVFNLYLCAVSSIYCTFNSVLFLFCYLITQIEHLDSCNLVERAGIEPATLTRVRPAFPLSYLPIYPLIAGIACPAHTTPRKGISTSFPCIFRHIHGAYCAGADSSSQTFIPRCWHAALLMSLRLPVSSGPQTLSSPALRHWASPCVGDDSVSLYAINTITECLQLGSYAPPPSCRLRDVWCADLSHFYFLVHNKSCDLIENQTKYTFFHRIKYRFPRA